MITAQSKEPRHLVQFSDGMHQANADVLPIKGGMGAGFGPHELLEASLATCITMWIRMQADKLGIPVGPVAVSVSLKRDHPEEVVYEYSIKLEGELSDSQRATLLIAADDCPVRRTLLKRPSFQRCEPS
ncbi:MAG: OsmC family peroxiredoxin [Pedosphaera sp.]|nr:OsmC family peroxiredoxin [Pedosphaera sp.]